MKMPHYKKITMQCMWDLAMCLEEKKGKYVSRSWSRADIRGLQRLQHLEAILLLCCGQVRCAELNSTTTMAKRATETKGGYPCFLTPSLQADRSPGALSEHQATSGEALGVINSKSEHLFLLYNNSAHVHILYLTQWNNACTLTTWESINEQVELTAFPDQEEAVGSFTSALAHTEIHCSRLCESVRLCPSLSSLPLSLSSTGNTDRLPHICKWITLFVKIFCVCWIEKNGEEGVRGKGCSCHPSFLFFSL